MGGTVSRAKKINKKETSEIVHYNRINGKLQLTKLSIHFLHRKKCGRTKSIDPRPWQPIAGPLSTFSWGTSRVRQCAGAPSKTRSEAHLSATLEPDLRPGTISEASLACLSVYPVAPCGLVTPGKARLARLAFWARTSWHTHVSCCVTHCPTILCLNSCCLRYSTVGDYSSQQPVMYFMNN